MIRENVVAVEETRQKVSWAERARTRLDRGSLAWGYRPMNPDLIAGVSCFGFGVLIALLVWRNIRGAKQREEQRARTPRTEPIKAPPISPSARRSDGQSADPKQRAISACLRNGWDCTIQYVDNDGVVTERKITPIERESGIRLLAFCHLRDEQRHFRIDRMRAITVHSRNANAGEQYHVGQTEEE